MNGKEALERLDKHFYLRCYSFDTNENSNIREYEIIKQDLDRLEKLEKVIEMLKDKFNFTLDKPSPNGEYPLVYENHQSGLGRLAKILTQQEYELLKEWFGND